MKAIYERNKKLEGDNAILLRQMTDMRLLMEQDREAREVDRASREQEKASLDLLRAQLAQQSAQGPYPPSREFGPWTTDASSVHVPPYPPYQRYQ